MPVEQLKKKRRTVSPKKLPLENKTDQQLFLPLPQKLNPNNINEKDLLYRSIIALIFFIFGFNFATSSFFRLYPLFGVPYLSEAIISLVFALLGFYIIPNLLRSLKYGAERLIMNTVSEIVYAFWEQQTQRIQQARREKQRLKAEAQSAEQKQKIERGILVDTSVLIDGRVVDMAKTGFFDSVFWIHNSVLNELHVLADSSDKLKRQRGRRGLDMVKELKKHSEVHIHTEKVSESKVDKVLLSLAKKTGMRLMTLDFNLNKVATASGIRTLNLNELVNALKTVLLPGEELTIDIIQPGKEKQQGVGYFPDGSMVIVEGAADMVGTTVTAKVSKLLQSSAGRMIFCELVG